MSKDFPELARRIVATAALTFTASIFWAFMIGAVCKFVFGLVDQQLLLTVIALASVFICVVLLPKVWKLMLDH